MAPKLSPKPGKPARIYRKNKKSRLKHRRDELERGKSPAKRKYRRDLLKIRRKLKPGPQQDVSHKGKKLTIESRKKNRARGGAKRK